MKSAVVFIGYQHTTKYPFQQIWLITILLKKAPALIAINYRKLDNYNGSIMPELILARHGETLWNVQKTYRGRTDVNLDEAGIKQAELLSKYLSNYGLEGIYSSPLKRANG